MSDIVIFFTMKKALTTIVICLSLTFLLTGCDFLNRIKSLLSFGERETFNYGVTAQQWFSFIDERAKKWRKDAYFFSISETTVSLDGLSDKWHFLFHSPSSDKQTIIKYEAGFISEKEAVLTPLAKIKYFKIDSPTAIHIADKYGGNDFKAKNKTITLVISLIGPPIEYPARPTIWVIKYYGDMEIFTVMVNAATGKIVR